MFKIGQNSALCLNIKVNKHSSMCHYQGNVHLSIGSLLNLILFNYPLIDTSCVSFLFLCALFGMRESSVWLSFPPLILLICPSGLLTSQLGICSGYLS